MEFWDSADEQLCGLVDRLGTVGHRHTLEAELRFTHTEGDPSEIDFTKLLSRFREKGVVTVPDVARGQILHSSISKRLSSSRSFNTTFARLFLYFAKSNSSPTFVDLIFLLILSIHVTLILSYPYIFTLILTHSLSFFRNALVIL